MDWKQHCEGEGVLTAYKIVITGKFREPEENLELLEKNEQNIHLTKDKFKVSICFVKKSFHCFIVF